MTTVQATLESDLESYTRVPEPVDILKVPLELGNHRESYAGERTYSLRALQ